LIEALLRRSWWVVGFFALVSAFAAVGALRTHIEFSVESFFPKDNPVMKSTRQVRETFGTGKNEIVVLYADDVFVPDRLNAIRALTAALQGVEGVTKVVSLANAPRMREEDGFLLTDDLVPADNPGPEEIAAIRKYLATNYALKDGLLAARDGSSANVMIQIDPGFRMEAMSLTLDRVIRDNWKDRYEATGEPVLSEEIMRVMGGIPAMAAIALLVILAFLLFNFRSAIGILVPLVQLLVGLLWGMGALGLAGIDFLALMAVAPIAILAVGSSFSLHLLGRYFLELSHGHDKAHAIRTMLGRTGLGVFVSGLAISASMLTFLLSELDMIRGMGLLTAVGIISCMFASLVLLPAMLNLLPAPKVRMRAGQDADTKGGISVKLRLLGAWIGRHPKAILATGAILVALSLVGIFRIVPDSSIIAYFPKKSVAVRGMLAVEKALGGSTTVSMVVSGDMQDPGLLKALLRFQEEGRSIKGVGPIQSLAATVRTLHETLSGEAGMPGTRELVAQELLVYQSSGSVDDVTSQVNLDYTQGLVTIIVARVSTSETKVIISRLEALAATTLGDRAKVVFTGDCFVESILEDIVLRDFTISLSLAVLLVLLIDSMIRSFRAALVTIIVLFFTILLQYGVQGLFGLAFNMASALMGALAIGVGDYAIHLTVRYMEDRRKGLTPEQAVEEAVATSGRSIVYTSLTLGGGFAALTFSTFVPVATLGTLMIFTVFAVGIASLTILPAACLVFLRNPVKSRMEVSR
jgi:predicted RND superfamily exporter protein